MANTVDHKEPNTSRHPILLVSFQFQLVYLSLKSCVMLNDAAQVYRRQDVVGYKEERRASSLTPLCGLLLPAGFSNT